MKRFLKLLISVVLILAVDTRVTNAQDQARVKGKAKAKATARGKPVAKNSKRKKETVNDMLAQAATGRGKNIAIKKQTIALPTAIQAPVKNPVPLGQVKPPRSNELFRDAGSDEEKLEQVTEQGIQE